MTFYNHAKHAHTGSILREVVFGMEDGMVSTLGSLTGIAVGSQSADAVILAGCVIIAVESISMGIGSYLSNTTKQFSDKKRIAEEEEELRERPHEEAQELETLFLRDGWPQDLVRRMVNEVVKNKKLMLTEMSYRELQIFAESPLNAITSGAYMFVSYVIGGFIPLLSYLILPISRAPIMSIVTTLGGLFVLGIAMAKYTDEPWKKSGMRILIVGGIAMSIGLLVGSLFSGVN